MAVAFSQLLQSTVTEAGIVSLAFRLFFRLNFFFNVNLWMLYVVTSSLGIVSTLLKALSCLFVPYCPKLYLHESFELLTRTGTLPENTPPIMQQKHLVCDFSLL